MAWHEILQGLITNLIESVPRQIEAIGEQEEEQPSIENLTEYVWVIWRVCVTR